jgi:hypothetical protein
MGQENPSSAIEVLNYRGMETLAESGLIRLDRCFGVLAPLRNHSQLYLAWSESSRMIPLRICAMRE